MRLWRLSQHARSGWDTYDSAVVAANTEEEARAIHPGGYEDDEDDSWPRDRACVDVQYLGEAVDNILFGIVVASFNAG
jgi:hypothetical protein